MPLPIWICCASSQPSMIRQDDDNARPKSYV